MEYYKMYSICNWSSRRRGEKDVGSKYILRTNGKKLPIW